LKTIQLDFDCNNLCVFCAQGELRRGSSSASAANLGESAEVELAAQLRDTAGEIVAFVGGEPTLRADLLTLVSMARAGGARHVLVQTNGRKLAGANVAEALRRSGVDRLDVSLHGSTAAMHDYHSGVPGSFAETVRGLRRAKAAGLEFSVSTVVTRSNYRHLADVVRVAHTLGASRARLLPAKRLGSAARHWERVLANPSLAKPYMRAAARTARALGVALAPDPTTDGWFGPLGATEPPPDASLDTPYPARKTGPDSVEAGERAPSPAARSEAAAER